MYSVLRSEAKVGQFMSKKAALSAFGLVALALVAVQLLVPRYVTRAGQSRALKKNQDLRVMRAVIAQYTLDQQHRPHTLDDLVVAGYLRFVPLDPTTGHNDTWVVECSRNQGSPGIVGVDTNSGISPKARVSRCD